MLEAGWQDSIREKNRLGEHKEAERDLRKIKMGYYNELNTTDKLFVSYGLAFHSSKFRNLETANKYLLELKETIYEAGKKNYMVDYCRYLWLHVNINQENMSEQDLLLNMLEIHDYFNSIEDYINSLSALANLYSLQKNGDMVLKLLLDLLNSNIYIKEETLNSFLSTLKKLDNELYIKGSYVINKYINETTDIKEAN